MLLTFSNRWELYTVPLSLVNAFQLVLDPDRCSGAHALHCGATDTWFPFWAA